MSVALFEKKKVPRVDPDEKLAKDLLKQVDAGVMAGVDQIIQKRLQNISQLVERQLGKNIDKIFLAAIGFSTSFGELRVDHTNGRQTQVANELGAKLRAKVLEIFQAIDIETLLENKKDKIAEALQREIEDQLHRLVQGSKNDRYVNLHYKKMEDYVNRMADVTIEKKMKTILNKTKLSEDEKEYILGVT